MSGSKYPEASINRVPRMNKNLSAVGNEESNPNNKIKRRNNVPITLENKANRFVKGVISTNSM